MVVKPLADAGKLDLLWVKNKNHYKKKLGCFQMEEISYFLKQIYWRQNNLRVLFFIVSQCLCAGVFWIRAWIFDWLTWVFMKRLNLGHFDFLNASHCKGRVDRYLAGAEYPTLGRRPDFI